MSVIRPKTQELKALRLAFFSPVPLTSMAQRPHALARWLSERGAQVIWVDPSPSRLPRLQDLTNLFRSPQEPKNVAQAWWVSTCLRPARIPLEPILPGLVGRLQAPIIRQLETLQVNAALVGKPSQLALNLLSRHPDLPMLMDVMDDMGAFHDGISRRYLEQVERQLAARAQLIWVSASALRSRIEAFAPRQTPIASVPNGLDTQRLELCLQAEVSHPSKENPIFGYLGTLGSWFDWDAITKLALAHTRASIRLIGPLYSPPPSRLPDNVQLQPAVASESVGETLRSFDLGLIPFRKNRLTESVDPIKYYEYRAAGIPTLSSRFGTMSDRGPEDAVWFLEDGLSGVEDALRARETLRSPEGVLRRRAWAESCSWSSRFDAAALPEQWVSAQSNQSACSLRKP